MRFVVLGLLLVGLVGGGGVALASAQQQSDAPRYANCAAARDAGVAPISAGQPGYRPGLDRDHDGIACEDNDAPDDQNSHPVTVTPLPSRVFGDPADSRYVNGK